MGNLKNWLDLGQQERDALNFVIDDAAVSVDVYRRRSQAGSAGLTARTEDQEPLRTIVVRLDEYRYRREAQGTTKVETTLLGITTDTDVRQDDLWRTTSIANVTTWYRVASVRRTQLTSSATLERVKR